MLAMSTFTSRSPGKYVRISATIIRVTGSRFDAASAARRSIETGSASSGFLDPASASVSSHSSV